MSELKKFIAVQGFPTKLTEEGQEILDKMRLIGYRCTHLIVVDTTNLVNPQQWIIDHTKYFPSTLPNPDPNCTHDRKYIDVIKYLDEEKDNDKTKLAGWLKFYGHNICFKETNDYIECSHWIQDEIAEELLSYVPVVDSIKFSDINAELLRQGYNYKTDNYLHYIGMELVNQKVQISIMNDYNPLGHCYSVPMIRWLVEKYGTDTDGDGINEIEFGFRVADVYGINKTYISIVVNGKEQYYDFSQIPNVARGNTRIPYLSFSPL